MGTTTKIEWADATLNLWWGCTKVSDGCKFCYAEHLADGRFGKNNWGPNGTRQEVKSWRRTLSQIAKRAKKENRRLKVFVQSMSDTFEGPETMGGIDSDNWKLVSRLQDELLLLIPEYPQLDFLLLTKRPQNVLDVVHRHDGYDTVGYNWEWPKNLWIGTSVENQKTAEERIPHLLNIPAKIRFLSCEPLLDEINTCFQNPYPDVFNFDVLRGICMAPWGVISPLAGAIDWVIAGGESGANARPMHPNWVRGLRDQCREAGVPFFFKQWGEWLPASQLEGSKYPGMARDLVKLPYDECTNSYRVGKKDAGRLLDGQEYNELPRGIEL